MHRPKKQGFGSACSSSRAEQQPQSSSSSIGQKKQGFGSACSSSKAEQQPQSSSSLVKSKQHQQLQQPSKAVDRLGQKVSFLRNNIFTRFES